MPRGVVMANNITIEVEETCKKGRNVAHVTGFNYVGELTYSRTSPTLTMDGHTGVPNNTRGRGIGVKLSERVVSEARNRGIKIVPLYPLFKAQADRHMNSLNGCSYQSVCLTAKFIRARAARYLKALASKLTLGH